MLGGNRRNGGGNTVRVLRSIMVIGALGLLLSGCTGANFPGMVSSASHHSMRTASPHAAEARDTALPLPPASHGEIDISIARYSDLYKVPEPLIRRIIVRESGYN